MNCFFVKKGYYTLHIVVVVVYGTVMSTGVCIYVEMLYSYTHARVRPVRARSAYKDCSG